MVESRRDIGEEILEGIRQLKRAEHGRIINMPAISSIREEDGAVPVEARNCWVNRSVPCRNGRDPRPASDAVDRERGDVAKETS